jgi:hypothetical protein
MAGSNVYPRSENYMQQRCVEPIRAVDNRHDIVGMLRMILRLEHCGRVYAEMHDSY